MSLSWIYTRTQVGIHAALVTVETHLSSGLPSFSVVGLPEIVVKESKDRVRSAIINSGFEFPMRRITVNLAPANLPKQGSCFDLPIALSILAASKQISDTVLKQYEFIGELALDGAVREVLGSLPALLAANQDQRILCLPEGNLPNIQCYSQAKALSVYSLLQVCEYLNGQTELLLVKTKPSIDHDISYPINFADIKEQFVAKRALEIAAAGGHNILFKGPPGSGKTLLAKALPSILPPLTEQEVLSRACVYSIQSKADIITHSISCFRAPHHSSSAVALIGGGAKPQPGEVSLAHHGVLFLDELPEFDYRTLDMLREPLEEKCVNISRANYQVTYPADFQLVAAMNPCPCGFLGDLEKSCGYFCQKAIKYQQRISGPLLDRIDLHINIQPVNNLLIKNTKKYECSSVIRQRVIKARDIQYQRQSLVNARLLYQQLETYCPLNDELSEFLQIAMDKMNFSARVAHKIIRIARTIADLDNSTDIQQAHLYEAMSYRCADNH